jgi:murein DD-endopeptidase MepM/ murein hydrolase activator NlpD
MLRRGIFLAAILLLASCDYSEPAKVNVINLGLHSDSSNGALMVQEGETVWNIAKRYRLPVRDIIEKNNLSPPYALKPGQRLRLPAPVEYKARMGDTIETVAMMFGVGAYQLAEVNNLQKPFYRITPGQTLRLPSSQSSSPPQQQKAVETGSALAPPAVERAELPPPVMAVPIAPPATPALPPFMPSVDAKKFIWPVKGKVISSYGAKAGGMYNDGINIASMKGAAVAAAASGTVVYVGDDIKSYGNLVLIRHGNGMTTAYAHLSSIKVKKGQAVKQGQTIGAVGTSGGVAGSQLHFEIRQGSKTYDPRAYLG